MVLCSVAATPLCTTIPVVQDKDSMYLPWKEQGITSYSLTGRHHALLHAGQAALIDSRCSSSYFTGGGSFI